MNRKSQLPDSPTVESARIADEIEKDKEITRDNIYNAVIMTNQARNAIEKSFENVDTNSPGYYDKLNDHAKKLDEIDKIGKSLTNLIQNTSTLDKRTINNINNVREAIDIPILLKLKIFFENIIAKKLAKPIATGLGYIFEKIFNLDDAYELYLLASRWKRYNYLNKNGILYDSINEINHEKYNVEEIKNRVTKETNGRLTDCKVLILNPNSSLAQKITSSVEFNNFLKNNLKLIIKNLQLENSEIEFKGGGYDKFETIIYFFNNKILNFFGKPIINYGLESDLFNSLHGVQIKDVRYKNRIIFFRIEDFYNFNKGRPSVKARLGERYQNQGKLENFYIIINIEYHLPNF